MKTQETSRSSGEAGREPSGRRVVRRLSAFVRPHWRLVAAGLAMMFGKSAMALAKPWPVKLALDELLTKEALRGSTLKLFAGVLLLVVAIAVLEGLFSYLQTLFTTRAGRIIVFDLRTALFDKVQQLSLQFHGRRKTGDLMARLTSDVKSLKGLITESLLEILASALLLITMGGVLLWLDWKLALIPLVAAPFLGGFLQEWAAGIRKLSRRERRSEGALATVLNESLGAIRVTRTFHRESRIRARFLRESSASLESGFASTMVEQRIAWRTDAVWSLVTATVLGLGVWRVMSGAATAGELIVFVHYVKDYYKPFRTLLRQYAKVTRAQARAERVVELLDMETGVTDRPDAVGAPLLRGDIELRGVDFAYEKGREVLCDVSLTIPAGKITALVGPTGCGKSTLVSLIPRLYDPTGGTVTIGGEDIRRYTLSSLRSQIGVVLQESILLRATIAENIAFGRRHATMDEVRAAASAANAHEFIAKLSDGYATEVGERGDTLSGGQRQRIAIARAMIADAPILILDEPLVGLDPSAAGAVLKGLEELMRGKTVIVVTHRLETIRGAERIVVMDEGKVLQVGCYAELAVAKGKFRELCRQDSSFQPARS